MLSKIRISADATGAPVIRIDYKPSEDMRDDFIQRFFESLMHGSTVHFFGYDETEDGKTAVLKPVAIQDYPEYIAFMQEQYNQLFKIGQSTSQEEAEQAALAAKLHASRNSE